MEPSIGAPPREEWFAQKYRGYTPKRLAGALEEITLRSIQLNNQCFEQEFASGRYDVVFQNAGESAGKSTTGLTRYRVDETYDGKDGRTRLHVASLSKEWYPDAFALQEEVLWLLRSTQQNPKEDE